ncbi:MAG: hypothetical protein M3O09_15170 [Acidobacteriota bacterium]|nr:hypothetical protein [Acidobacteriota bacterium]
MKKRTGLSHLIFQHDVAIFLLVLVILGGSLSFAQETSEKPPNSGSDAVSEAVHELQQQVSELRAAVSEMRSEAAEYRAETLALRRELEATRAQSGQPGSQAPEADHAASTEASAGLQPGSLDHRVEALEGSSQLLSGKVDEQYQTKVESASKYKVRLSGIVLMNLFSNRGAVENQDFPTYANPRTPYDSNGTFGATLRQSEIGLEAFGPTLAGAKTSAQIQFDLSGGFPNTLNGFNYGLVRLRIASMRMDWKRTSLIVGQDSLFLSPLSPTSFASLAVPAFSYAGNLWGWIPQVRLEHRFDLSDSQSVTLQGGILDNLTGEPPYTQYQRQPQAGGKSAQPAYGSRVAWSHLLKGHPLTLGTAGYYGRQNWAFYRHTDSWAGMADWEIPITSQLSISGELYRGKAVGSFGGGIGQSVLFDGDPLLEQTHVLPLNSVGGWSQIKFRATPKLEFNGAIGLDNPFARDLRVFPASQGIYDLTLLENRSAFGNFIFRPRSDLIFSAEYRHLRTLQIYNGNSSAEQFNLMMGVLF